MKFTTIASTLTLASTILAAETLTTFSLAISRDGAVFTKVITSTIGVTPAWAAEYATETGLDAVASTIQASSAAEFSTDSTVVLSSSTAPASSTFVTTAAVSSSIVTSDVAESSVETSSVAAASIYSGAGSGTAKAGMGALAVIAAAMIL